MMLISHPFSVVSDALVFRQDHGGVVLCVVTQSSHAPVVILRCRTESQFFVGQPHSAAPFTRRPGISRPPCSSSGRRRSRCRQGMSCRRGSTFDAIDGRARSAPHRSQASRGQLSSESAAPAEAGSCGHRLATDAQQSTRQRCLLGHNPVAEGLELRVARQPGYVGNPAFGQAHKPFDEARTQSLAGSSRLSWPRSWPAEDALPAVDGRGVSAPIRCTAVITSIVP